MNSVEPRASDQTAAAVAYRKHEFLTADGVNRLPIDPTHPTIAI